MTKKNGALLGLAAALLVVVIVLAVALGGLVARQKQAQQEQDAILAEKAAAYEAAMELYEAGAYEDAIRAFAELGDYRDALEQIERIRQARQEQARQAKLGAALKVLQEGSVLRGKEMLEAMGDDPDAQGILKQIQYLPVGVSIRTTGISMASGSLSYHYNADGTVCSAVYVSGEDPEGDTLVLHWEDGRPTELASEARAFYYTYDGSGNLAVVQYVSKGDLPFADFTFSLLMGAFVWRNGDTVTFTYDAAGNRTGCACRLSSEILGDFTESYRLDGQGRILEVERKYASTAETYRCQYDGERLTEVVRPTGDGTETVLRYEYDEEGRLTCIRLALGLTVDYVFGYDWVYLA